MLARIEPPSFLFCPVKGRCYVSNAARHRGNRVVHCLDIKKFFPNTPRVRVIAFFQSIMGCRADVAGILGDLCTFEGHLPTGSPLSPILAYYSYQLGRASCRERVCPYVSISLVAVSLNKKQ